MYYEVLSSQKYIIWAVIFTLPIAESRQQPAVPVPGPAGLAAPGPHGRAAAGLPLPAAAAVRGLRRPRHGAARRLAPGQHVPHPPRQVAAVKILLDITKNICTQVRLSARSGPARAPRRGAAPAPRPRVPAAAPPPPTSRQARLRPTSGPPASRWQSEKHNSENSIEIIFLFSQDNHSPKKKEPHIKKPLNAFMLYMKVSWWNIYICWIEK